MIIYVLMTAHGFCNSGPSVRSSGLGDSSVGSSTPWTKGFAPEFHWKAAARTLPYLSLSS